MAPGGTLDAADDGLPSSHQLRAELLADCTAQTVSRLLLTVESTT
jgi:hypothetical protein